MRKIFIAFLALVFALSSYVPSVSAETSYGEGSLLKAPDSTTVYYIGPDGKKYVFPEGKTFSSWFDDFSQVQEVSIEELDQYPDGGAMPIKGGARLVTHINTANVYAVENGGILRRIPNEAKARELFGDDWASRVVDVLPGFFATTYQMGDEVSDTLPNGYLITDGKKYYYVENGEKSLMTKEALRLNNLKEDNALRIKNINRYKNKAAISVQKKSLANFVPPLKDVEDKKVRVCHNGHTISISKNALPAHIRIGDSLGACGDKINNPEDPDETPTEVEPGAWCSVLLGMFNSDTLGYASDDPHDVLDINGDGVVNLSDNAMLVDLYNNEDNQACLDHIEDAYTEDDYQNLDWCNGLVQGISDNLGDTSPFDPFDLNDDDKINLSDVSMVASYLYEGDQAQCYSEYDGYLDEIVDQTPVDNDADDDGYDSEASGGDDCNDNDSDINPGVDEIADDGIDQDCDGEDLVSSTEAVRLVFENFEDSDWTDNFERAVNEENVSFSSEVAMGSTSARMYGGYLGASFDYIFADHDLPNAQDGDKYYIRYYTYYEDSVDWENVSVSGWKQFRGMPPDGWPLVMLKFGEGSHEDLFTHAYFESLDDDIPDRMDISRPSHNEWHLHEYYISYGHDSGGFAWYIDGELVAGIPPEEHTMDNWPRDTGTPVYEVDGFRFGGGNGAVPNSVYYIDNIEIWKGIPETTTSGELNISSLSDSELNHGSTYIINGSSFGSTVSDSPVLWDTVDNQSFYEGLESGDDIPVAADRFWTRNGTQWSDPLDYYTSDLRNARSTAQYHLALKGSLGSKDLGGSEVPEFYATWWINPSHDIYNGPNGLASTKIIRVWESGDGNGGRLSWTGNQLTAGFGSVNEWANWGGDIGEWNRVEIYIDSANGIIKTYTNGELIHDVDHMELNGHYLNRIWVLGLDPSIPENLDSDLTVDFDDVYVDTNQARVEICSGSSWNTRGMCEIQIKTDWSDSQISFKANQGSFAENETLYLYVIDQDGNASDAYSISF